MPRHDRYEDDTRERSDYRDREYGQHNRDRGAFFSDRDDRYRRDRDENRRRIGGWGGLMGDDSSGGRDRDRERMGRRDEEHRYGSDDYNRGVPMDETERLIASNKVEGTPVYDRNGDKLGSIHNFMVDKRKGQVVYAVLKHGGGFLGLGERYYPLEWDHLTYDTRLGGYHVQMTEDDLQSFGSFDSEGRWQSRARGGRMDRDRDSDYRRERMRSNW